MHALDAARPGADAGLRSIVDRLNRLQRELAEVRGAAGKFGAINTASPITVRKGTRTASLIPASPVDPTYPALRLTDDSNSGSVEARMDGIHIRDGMNSFRTDFDALGPRFSNTNSAGADTGTGGGLTYNGSSAVVQYYTPSITSWMVLDTNIKLETPGTIIAPPIYSSTVSASANVAVSSTGVLQRISSARKYKTDIAPAEWGAKILDIVPVTFLDKKMKTDQVPGWDKRLAGVIAEDVAAAGLEDFVYREPTTGEIESVFYDRMFLALIPLLKSTWGRLKTVESRLGITINLGGLGG